MMRISILFVLVIMAYSSLTRSSGKMENNNTKPTDVQLVQNH
ncbi:MAG TPA: hypothetical protein VJ552_13845 [Sediminibacterium sp.]|nr:hypothetical protein [Sediminibacterium sp.]